MTHGEVQTLLYCLEQAGDNDCIGYVMMALRIAFPDEPWDTTAPEVTPQLRESIHEARTRYWRSQEG